MKYLLEDPKKNTMQNLLSWMRRFLRFKITTLSNRLVTKKEEIFSCLEILQSDLQEIKILENTCKKARNAGLIGLNTYTTPLLKFYNFISQKNLISLRQIDEEILNDFLAIYTSALSSQTRKNYRIVLINFFNFINKKNQLENQKSHLFDISLKNSIQRSGQKLPAYIKQEEIKIFLQSLRQYPSQTAIQKRDRAIITLIIFTGIRISEALNLTLKDISLEGEFYLLNIRGKGDKSRTSIIKAKNLQKDLKEWLLTRNAIPSINNNILFCNKNGQAISQAYIYKKVNFILRYAGIKKEKMGAHMLRHSFATLLYQKHKDLVLVQEALGHADLNTSRIYTHFDKDHLKKTANLIDEIK